MTALMRADTRAPHAPPRRRHALASGAIATLVASLLAAGTTAPAAAQSVAAPPAPTIGLVRDARLADAMGAINADTLRWLDSMLVSFGTRHTMSDTLSTTRGIGAARRFIHGWLSNVAKNCDGCLRVEYDPAMMTIMRRIDRPTFNVVNVLAWLPGRDTNRVVVMGGHYDSCICSINSFDSASVAPGADDDGSGTVAVMELARVFAERFPQGLDATVVFALYAGEELGLLGSTHLAQRLDSAGYEIVAAFTDDIVGNTVADDGTEDDRTVRIFADDPDNSPSRELGRYTWAISGTYDAGVAAYPVWRLDRIGRGGDHSPFVRNGHAGLRFSERLENYKRQHLPTDDLEHVNFEYLSRVARLNLGVVGALALAPAKPDSVRNRRDRESGGQKWAITWAPVEGATGYEILWRSTFAPSWERVIPVGTKTTHVLDEQLDDGVAGVRAVGANGHRSMAAVVPAPQRPRSR